MAADKPRARLKAAAITRAPRAIRVISAAKLRKLADALERDDADPVAQIQALDAQVIDPAAAAAVLAHTARGAPVARAYLEVLASDAADPLPAADTVARYCATIARGRKVLRPVFVATWQRAADATALEAAWKNLARIAIDDPALLTVAVEAAR